MRLPSHATPPLAETLTVPRHARRHRPVRLALRDADAPLAATLEVIEDRARLHRRRALRGLAGAALGASPLGALACSLIPAETAGPYPGDGTNGPNVLTQSGIVRSDIRSSFGSAGTTTAPGTPLTVTVTLVK